jgi:hypothetical protein
MINIITIQGATEQILNNYFRESKKTDEPIIHPSLSLLQALAFKLLNQSNRRFPNVASAHGQNKITTLHVID